MFIFESESLYIHPHSVSASRETQMSSLHILCRLLTRAFLAWQSNNYRNLMCSLIYTAILYSLIYINFVVGDVCSVVQSTRTTIFRDILWVHIDRTLQTTARLHASSCILWINHWFRYTGTPLERGTWSPQFTISIISSHDCYYPVPHPPAQGTSMFSAMLKHFR